MANRFDLIVRGGLVIDGTGAERREADIAIDQGRIVAVGSVNGSGLEEVDARGRIVTPGFIDVHTHYDAQAIWSERLVPSSAHGVTTAVMGNCGVGFAPCRPSALDRQSLVGLLEGVEDIPQIAMTEGLDWAWEGFPSYLDAIDRRPHDIDLAAYLPHSALRIFVMGDRGARREPATADDLQRMAALTTEALQAGAIGFSTSRLILHRTADGELAPSFGAAETELNAIARSMKKARRGTFQIVSDLRRDGSVAAGFDLLRRLAVEAGGRLSYSMAQTHTAPEDWRETFALTREANRHGLKMSGQFLPRPMGIVVGHTLSSNPFSLCPSYGRLRSLPLPELVRELRKPDVRQRILSETPDASRTPIALQARDFGRMYPLGAVPDYEPSPATSAAAQAAARNLPADEFAYDALLEDDGRALWLVTFGNYAHHNLDAVHDMLCDPNAIPGVGDGGAHYGYLCDATYPTTVLAHWTRDRHRGPRITLEAAVRVLTGAPAAAFEFADRGILGPGYKADLNVIDHDGLGLGRPFVTYDLPGGARRLQQDARGYVATIVSGRVTYRNGEATGALPGRLYRAG